MYIYIIYIYLYIYVYISKLIVSKLKQKHPITSINCVFSLSLPLLP